MDSSLMTQMTIGELLRRHRLDACLTQKDLAKLLSYDHTTISRVERNERLPSQAYVEEFANALHLSDIQRQELMALYEQATGKGAIPAPALTPTRHEDWGEAPDVSIFYGRQEELAALSQWVVTDRCRLVAVLGMGGIGKTALVTRLAEQIKETFDYLIWRSLRNAPPLEDILADCLKFLSDQQQTDLPENVGGLISLLIDYLRQQRCLIVLDNAEAILQAGDRAGHYRAGYEVYSQLLQRVGQTVHQSCLVLTSREKPKEFVPLAGDTAPVRSMVLAGLDQAASRELTQDRQLSGDEAAWTALVQRYAGNPLALRQVSATIQDLYGGDIITFLEEITTMFGDIRYLLDQQFSRLSALEQDVMYWLAINREPVSLKALREDLVRPVSPGELLEALEALQRRSLIEKSAGRFTLQNVITEYLTGRLIERVCEEIVLGKINLFQSHALMKATAKAYVRESQVRLILKPVGERLLATLSKQDVEGKLGGILSTLREESPLSPGYAGGNVLNLLVHLESKVSDYDFSHLTIWQAYLQRVELQDVNFARGDLARSVFTGTFGVILSVTFSPDGALLAAGTENGEIRLWHITDGKPQFIYEGHGSHSVNTVTFHPYNNNLLASGGGDQTVRVWNVTTGQCLHLFKGHSSGIRSVVFHPNRKIIASSSSDHTIRFWSLDTGDCVKVLSGHTDTVRSISFSLDGQVLASASHDQTIKIWDVESGQCRTTLQGHSHRVTSVAFSPRKQHLLVSGSSDKTIRVWNIKTGLCLTSLTGHSDSIRSITFSPDGHILVSGSGDQSIRIWQIDTGKCIHTISGHSDGIWSIAFSPSREILASGGRDQTVRIWDLTTKKCVTTFQGYADIIWSIAFSPDGETLASGSGNKTIRLWNVQKGQCINVLRGSRNTVRSIKFSPDGRLLVSGSRDHLVRLWNIKSKQISRIFKKHNDSVWSVAFDPKGILLASGSGDCKVCLWDINRGHCLRVFDGHADQVRSVVFSPKNELLITASQDKTIRLWELSTGQCIKILKGHLDTVWSIAVHPNSELLASGSGDQTVKLWNIRTGKCLGELHGHTNQVTAVSFSPQGKLLASAGADRKVQIWDYKAKQVLRTLEGHSRIVWSIAYSPDGTILASGSLDEAIKF